METKRRSNILLSKNFHLALGPLLFIFCMTGIDEQVMAYQAKAVLASTLWIAIWWITEAIPIAVTSLLPLVLFPLTNGLSIKDTALPYSNPIIYLYAGGFMIALAMEKWMLHKRIALNIILKTGTQMHQLVLGFMLATAFLSMWISNTATSVMMLPIGLAVIQQFQSLLSGNSEEKRSSAFGKALMLAIAYSASIGGISTLVGSPTNLVVSGFVSEFYQQEIDFTEWMLLGLPISIVLLFLCWQHLVRNAYRLDNKPVLGGGKLIRSELLSMGQMSGEEKRVLLVFATVALAWIFRKTLITPVLPQVNDTIIALVGATLLFIIPAPSREKEALIDWETALKLPWGILLLFGGGFAIAKGFADSGLAAWLGQQLTSLDGIPFFFLLLIVVATVNFLTEITSNVATCTLMMPVLAELAPAVGVHPYGLMVAACISASCAFMLPVATPPNAVVFGSGYLSIREMVRAGFVLNLISILVVSLAVYFLMPLVWGIDLQVFPSLLSK